MATVGQRFERIWGLFGRAYYEELMTYGQECLPMTLRMDRLKILFSPNDRIDDVHYCMNGGGEGEDCFAFVKRLTLEVCDSYAHYDCKEKRLTFEQKVLWQHLLTRQAFRLAWKEGSGVVPLQFTVRTRYIVYVRFLLRILQYLVRQDLVHFLHPFFENMMLIELANPTNWMAGRSIVYDYGDFDALGDTILTSKHCIPFIESQCKHLAKLLVKFYIFVLVNCLDDSLVSCKACEAFRANPEENDECSVVLKLQADIL